MLGLVLLLRLVLSVAAESQNEYIDRIPYMDIRYTLGKKNIVSRIHFELFWDSTPKTAMNFAKILEGRETKKGRPIAYKNTIFHRIISGFMMQGGDFEHSNGSGGYSIFKHDKFNDENFVRKHTSPGVLSMANAGKNTNGSQFFITFAACPHLNGHHVVFGKVRDDGDLKKIAEIAKVATDRRDAPVDPVQIINCGFLDRQAQSDSDHEAVL